MVAYMNEEAFNNTLKTGKMTYWSRSRQELWLKGLTSGHFQYVKSLALDCDNDTILAKVDQIGAACHTGSRSCFFKPLVQKDTTTPIHFIYFRMCMMSLPTANCIQRKVPIPTISLRKAIDKNPQESRRRVRRDHHCRQEP